MLFSLTRHPSWLNRLTVIVNLLNCKNDEDQESGRTFWKSWIPVNYQHVTCVFGLRKQPTFHKVTTWALAQRFHTDDVSLAWSRKCFWLVETWGNIVSNDQKHYLDLGSDMSSVWNFLCSYSDIVLWGLKLWPHETLAVFSG